MKKSELVERVAQKVNILTKKQIEIIIDMIFDCMKDSLSKGEKIEIRGFANFKLKQRQERIARNPKTGEQINVPPQKAINFKMSKALKEALNK
ncbi:MAG TPA: HU family DNA-binding protein [Thermodesulfovibrio thiophilus]|uniref:HU family DNA-binding protein n=1 Tax=Thermodesulfovibrio thiophilus TaxID=340095 RepID=UPI00041E7A3E|nr:HU family DNA-binding protein [Thermodesulfovibrio thiophilus]HHW20224.1 integration host factor subunit beta [Thermodesulfovibrio thiophilus]HOA83007.1 HU family DNA-binding protein [Thermodesulfovibrio thiophilus]HQA03493.1 HU family DNA-binding protein [Thermodesulfovibrio thiophilus]HQD36082.1 HU family DNA-binding protein [Thermodesulfovibrio thiophilus]